MDIMDPPSLAESLDHEYIMLLNQKNSPLLRLPAELRNEIFSLVFTDQIVRVVPWPLQSKFHPANPRHHDYSGPVALLLTSRQLNIETRALFLSTCIFDISLIQTQNEALAMLGSERCRAIESITIDSGVINGIIGGSWAFDRPRVRKSYFRGLRRLEPRSNYLPSEEIKPKLEKYFRDVFDQPNLEVNYEHTIKHLKRRSLDESLRALMNDNMGSMFLDR